MDPKDCKSSPLPSRSESLQHQNPYAYYSSKYKSDYHPFFKKTKLLGSRVIRWFKLTDRGLLYSNVQHGGHTQKIIPLDHFEISEARPLIKGHNFCIKLKRKRGSPYWIPCDTKEEKQFLMNYLNGGQILLPVTHNEEAIHIQNPPLKIEQAEIGIEESSETSGQFLEGFESFLIDEEIAAEIFKNEHITVEKRVQMYQKAYIKIGIDEREERRKRIKSFLADCSFDMVDTETGIGNDVPRLPCIKRIDNFYYRGCSAPIYHVGFEPLPKVMSDDSFDMNKVFDLGRKEVPLEKIQEDIGEIKRSVSANEADNAEEEDMMSDESMRISHSVRQVLVKDIILNPSSLMKQNLESQSILKSVRRTSNNRKRTCLGRPLINAGRSEASFNGSYSEISQKNEKETCSTKDAKAGDNKDQGMNSYHSIKVGKLLLDPQEESDDKDLDVNVREFDREKVKSLEDCVNTGHRLLWQYELGKAKECFGLYREQSTLVEIMDCECDLHEVLVTGREHKVKLVLNRLVNIAARVNRESNNVREDSEEHIELELNRTEVSLLKCIVYCFQGNKFQIIKTIADTWRGYRKVENLIKKRTADSTVKSLSLHRYKFGHGCFALTFSTFSPTLLKLIKLIGIKSDRNEGFRLLEECRAEHNIRSHYASIIATLYKSEILGQLDEACELVGKGLRDSHGSSLFYWVASLVCWKYTRMQDSNSMVKTALVGLSGDADKAVYFKYELGLHYFLDGEWETALAIFKVIASQTVSRAFISNHMAEAQNLAKSIKLGAPIDFTKWEADIENVPDEERCIMPCPVQIAIKIACCYFSLEKRDMGMKWLLCILMLYKKYSGIQTKGEEEFYQLALKYISKDSMKMLTFESYYFMKYLPKLPDERLQNILDELNEHQQGLIGSHDMSKPNPRLSDYVIGTLLIIVCNCLLGETELACEIYNGAKPSLAKLPEQYIYLTHHMEYWVGRALAEDEKIEEAREILKSKKKKCVLNIAQKVRQALVELDA